MNIEAIKTLQAIELEGRTAATPAEQAIWQRILAQKRRNAANSSVLQPTAP